MPAAGPGPCRPTVLLSVLMHKLISSNHLHVQAPHSPPAASCDEEGCLWLLIGGSPPFWTGPSVSMLERGACRHVRVLSMS